MINKTTITKPTDIELIEQYAGASELTLMRELYEAQQRIAVLERLLGMAAESDYLHAFLKEEIHAALCRVHY